MVGAEPVVLVIFIISFILILSEKLHRTIAAWAGCVAVSYTHLRAHET